LDCKDIKIRLFTNQYNEFFAINGDNMRINQVFHMDMMLFTPEDQATNKNPEIINMYF
jgi:hypothetical protein